MKVTVDANILFSCLIKDAGTRKVFFNPSLSLFAPEFIVKELLIHVQEVQKKSGLSDEDFSILVEKVFSQLRLIKDKDLAPFLPAAATLITDSKDWLYLACALREDSLLWSNDLGFKTQTRVKVMNTKEVIAIVGSL